MIKLVLASAIAASSISFVAPVTAHAASPASCGGAPISAPVGGVTITILPCPSGSKVNYEVGVPGQDLLVKNGLIALHNNHEDDGCNWVKLVRGTRIGDTVRGKQIETQRVAVPALGVLDASNGTITPYGNKIVAIESVAGSCRNRMSVVMTASEAVALYKASKK